MNEWYCEVCKKYSFKRKDKHFRTENHKIKQSRLDRKEAYEDYMIRRYYILMENTRLRPLSKYLEKSALFYKKLKKILNYFTKTNIFITILIQNLIQTLIPILIQMTKILNTKIM